MKSKLLLLILLFIVALCNAQNLKWDWGHSATGNHGADGSNIQTDASGNVYVAGYFYGPLSVFGSDTIYNVDTTSYDEDIFILKYSSAGSLTWHLSIGTPNGQVNYPHMVVDAFGNIYVSGTYADSMLVVGTDTLNNTNYSNYISSIFVAKINPAGQVLWIQSEDTSAQVNGLATDAAGNIYLQGSFAATQFIWGPNTLTQAGYMNSFVAKMDSSGHQLWATSVNDSAGGGQIYAIAGDAGGNTYITGRFYPPYMTIGNVTAYDTALYSYEIFTAKLNPSGAPVWVQNSEGNSEDEAFGITVDPTGSVYITGQFNSNPVYFGNVALGSEDTVGYPNYFIAKYNAAGNAEWAKTVTDESPNAGTALCTGANGTIYMTGYYSGPAAIYGNDTLINNYTRGQQWQLVICNYDTSGNIIWIAQSSDTGSTASTAITTDNAGNVYVTGGFSGQYLVIGSDTLPGSTADEEDNIFIARFGTFISAINNAPDVNTITVYPNPSSGNYYFKGMHAGSMLQIFDITGQQIFSTPVNNSAYQLNLSGKASGIYLYRILDYNNGTQEGKIVLN